MNSNDKRESLFDVTESGTLSMCGNSMRENRETHAVPSKDGYQGRSEKANNQTSDMNAARESDVPIVPAKRANKAIPAAESVEERGATKGNTIQQAVDRAQDREHTSIGLAGVRQLAKKDRNVRFTSLLHHVNVDLLRESFMKQNRKACPGVDQVTWKEYGRDLEDRLQDLCDRVHRGTYRAKPSKRTWIPKADGRQRPLGIACLEDKIVQQAVRTVLEQVYEEDFLGFSYGFRPERNQHNALDALWVGISRKKVNWVLDADIQGFFDAINHEWLLKFIEYRIADRRVLRLIRKWLRAGVSQDGEWSKTTVGTPQGAVISPLLANVYLHYVLDWWANNWRKTSARGDVIIVRYADDFVMGFQHQDDAKRFLSELKSRMERFGLRLHPEKTRLIEFGRFAAENRQRRGEGKPETFDFLGFTHYMGKTKTGRPFLKRRTVTKRMRAKLQEVKQKLRQYINRSVTEVGRWLRRLFGGWMEYHSVPENRHMVDEFRNQLIRLWLKVLRRRSQRGQRNWTWTRMNRLKTFWIPSTRIIHPYPFEGFDRYTQGRSRMK